LIAAVRLNQVTVAAADLDASIRFYELWGLKLIVKSPRYARFEAPEGEATFSLHLTDAEIPRANAPQIYFECNDVEAEVARLRTAGVDFAEAPKMQSWLWCEAWTRDPAGNEICLYNAGENRKHPPWRLQD
jgi:predicted enzyme related to lactoylglutathione lyase